MFTTFSGHDMKFNGVWALISHIISHIWILLFPIINLASSLVVLFLTRFLKTLTITQWLYTLFSSLLSQEVVNEKSSSNKAIKLDKILHHVSFYNQVVSGLSLLLLARFISDTLNITIGCFCALVYHDNIERVILETCSSLGFFFTLLIFVIHLDRLYEDIKSLATHLLEIEFHSEDEDYNR